MFKVRNLLLVLCLFVLAVPVFAQSAAALEYTVNLADSPLGQIMVGPNGMTLYTFDRDALDTSNCYDRCATSWPPLLVDNAAALSADASIPGEWGTTSRTDGTLQVTYNSQPLYYWFKDEKPGDTTGQAVGSVWWVATPATVYISRSADMGPFLVGPTGMTLYTFTSDTPGVSNCADQCLANWPALTVADAAAIVVGANVHGELGTITRADGALQVTYNSWPLYYFAKDAKRGDTTGEGVGGKWYIVAPETVVVASSEALGDHLVAGVGGKTLYTFKNDTAGASTCSGDCATAWPPFTVAANTRLVGGAGAAGALATITRDDGSLQVTYNGMPLYFYKDDAAAGDANGQGLGGVWFVAAP